MRNKPTPHYPGDYFHMKWCTVCQKAKTYVASGAYISITLAIEVVTNERRLAKNTR